MGGLDENFDKWLKEMEPFLVLTPQKINKPYNILFHKRSRVVLGEKERFPRLYLNELAKYYFPKRKISVNFYIYFIGRSILTSNSLDPVLDSYDYVYHIIWNFLENKFSEEEIWNRALAESENNPNPTETFLKSLCSGTYDWDK